MIKLPCTTMIMLGKWNDCWGVYMRTVFSTSFAAPCGDPTGNLLPVNEGTGLQNLSTRGYTWITPSVINRQISFPKKKKCLSGTPGADCSVAAVADAKWFSFCETSGQFFWDMLLHKNQVACVFEKSNYTHQLELAPGAPILSEEE